MARQYRQTRPTAAPANPAAESAIVKVMPTNAAEVAKLQAEAELAVVEDLPGIVVETPEDYQQADAVLTEILQRKDAITAMRTSATGPLYGVIRTVEGWFRPVLGAYTTLETTIKQRMGAYAQLTAEAEAEARRAAQTAVESGDAGALVESLNTAEDAVAVREAVAARVTFRWQVKRVAEDLLPSEYWTPDLAKIEAVAKAAGSAEEGSDGEPVIPGVVFERVANVAGSHGRR